MATIPTNTDPIKFQNGNGFTPHFTPREMLELGVFDGRFFFSVKSREGIPKDLFKDLPSSKWQNHKQTYVPTGGPAPHDGSILTPNYFRIKVDIRSRSMKIPMQLRMYDPMGWFQWYTRFYYGRVTPADDYRIRQWRNEVATLFFYIFNGNPVEPLIITSPDTEYSQVRDISQFKNFRQHLLHFGWDSTKDPVDFGIIL